MGVKPSKTNAVRLLDKLKVAYQLAEYEVDEHDLSATHLAQTLGMDVSCVYKTLVLKSDKNDYFVCLLAGDKEINLKMAAKAVGCKSCNLIPQKELLPLTGYIRGGCSPLGMKRSFPTFIDSAIQTQECVYVSAGKRGMQIKLLGSDLISSCKATVCSLTE